MSALECSARKEMDRIATFAARALVAVLGIQTIHYIAAMNKIYPGEPAAIRLGMVAASKHRLISEASSRGRIRRRNEDMVPKVFIFSRFHLTTPWRLRAAACLHP